MLATRSNERAANASGVNIARVKLEVFAASAFIAGVGGCLIAYRFGSVSDASFGAVASLTALAVAYLGGITCVSGAVTSGITASAGVAFYVIGNLIDDARPVGGVHRRPAADPDGDPQSRRHRRRHPPTGRGRQAQEAARPNSPCPVPVTGAGDLIIPSDERSAGSGGSLIASSGWR